MAFRTVDVSVCSDWWLYNPLSLSLILPKFALESLNRVTSNLAIFMPEYLISRGFFVCLMMKLKAPCGQEFIFNDGSQVPGIQ